MWPFKCKTIKSAAQLKADIEKQKANKKLEEIQEVRKSIRSQFNENFHPWNNTCQYYSIGPLELLYSNEAVDALKEELEALGYEVIIVKAKKAFCKDRESQKVIKYIRPEHRIVRIKE